MYPLLNEKNKVFKKNKCSILNSKIVLTEGTHFQNPFILCFDFIQKCIASFLFIKFMITLLPAIPTGLVVRIARSHRDYWGSIPRVGTFFLTLVSKGRRIHNQKPAINSNQPMTKIVKKENVIEDFFYIKTSISNVNIRRCTTLL